MDTMPQRDVKMNISVEAQLVPFGTFQTRVTHQVVEESAVTAELSKLQGAPPYVFPTRTGDIQGPMTHSVAG